MKRTISLCFAALLSCLMACPALAADAPLLPPTLYPAEVNEYAKGQEMRLERICYPRRKIRPVFLWEILNGRAGTTHCWM